MQTLEEKLRVLADAAQDGSEIIVQELVFQGSVSGFISSRVEQHELEKLLRASAVSIKQKPANDADSQKYSLCQRERDAVLAGLRLLQTHMEQPDKLSAAIRDILCDSGDSLTVLEIDMLCMKLNQW